MRFFHSLLLSTLLPISLCAASTAVVSPDDGPLDMDQVVRLVLENDPVLDERRLDLGVSEGRARAVRYWDDPEVRFYYTSEGDQRVPGAYTETLRQTRTEQGSESQATRGTSVENRAETRLGGKNGTEVRREQETRTAQEVRSESFSSRENETTTREFIPRRDGVLIRDTTRMQTSGSSTRATDESARTSGVERRTDEPNAIRTSGSETSRERQNTATSGRVTRVEETERLYAQSPYEGSDRYSVQLRLQPRNPWEVSRLLKQAKAEVSLAEFQLQAAQAQLAADVRRDFREVAGAMRIAELARLRVDVKKRDLQYFEALQQSGAPVLRQVSEKRAALSRETFRWREAVDRAEALQEDLALRAGLADASRLSMSGGAPPLLDFAAVDTNLVVQAAVETHPELAGALLELRARELGVEAVRAARIPWLTVLAVEAGYEEQYGEKVSDDYGIFAGVSLPVFSWMDENLGAEEKAGAEALKQRIDRLQQRVAGQVTNHLRRLAGSNRALAEFRKEGAAEKDALDQARKALEVGDEDSHRAAIAMEEAALEIQESEIDVEQRQADAILSFEQALGADLGILFEASSPNVSR